MDCIVHGVTKSWTRLSDFYSRVDFHSRLRCATIYYMEKNKFQDSICDGILLKKAHVI